MFSLTLAAISSMLHRICCISFTENETTEKTKSDKMTEINTHSKYEGKRDGPGYRRVTQVTGDNLHSRKRH